MKISRALGIAGLLLIAAFAAKADTKADTYPDRPIRMIVAWAAGGGTDIAARTVAKHMSQKLNVPIIVDNRAGASGMIGTEYVANAPADGYVIQYTVADSHSVNPHLFPKIRYDAVNDFVPVGVVGYNPCALVVNSQKSIDTLDQLIAAAKSRPGEITFATWGIGSGGHVRMAALMDAAGIKFLHVPYKGSGPALTAVAGGEVDAMIVPSGMAKQQADAGRVRLLAIDTVDRYQTVPEVKTYKEQGFDLNLRFWNAIFAPKGTPKAIVDKLNKALNAALDEPEAKADLARMGLVRLEIGDGSPSAAREYLDSEYKRWGGVISNANIQME
jgi:tripartite-type tricarboxylate transporter receptor subunit TctC